MDDKKIISYSNDKSSNEDNKLLQEIKNGSNEALEKLLNKYKELVNMKIGKYFIIGAEKEDIIKKE